MIYNSELASKWFIIVKEMGFNDVAEEEPLHSSTKAPSTRICVPEEAGKEKAQLGSLVNDEPPQESLIKAITYL